MSCPHRERESITAHAHRAHLSCLCSCQTFVLTGRIRFVLFVFTEADEALCGYSVQVDQTYLVYAYGEGPAFSTNLCTRTTPVYEGVIENEGLGEPKFVGVSEQPWSHVKKFYR